MWRRLRDNGLSLALLSLFVVFWVGQSIAGWLGDCRQNRELHLPEQTYLEYLTSGDFWEASSENWESEFLQMGAYVLMTAWLVQRGSAESKDPDSPEQTDEDPSRHSSDPRSPWPVRRGGFVRWLYANSLCLAFLLLFLVSLAVHAASGLSQFNEEQGRLGLPQVTVRQFITGDRFWFQSLQNWQSEFLAIFSMVVLSIFLRQRHSSQSKPVHAPHSKTGK